MPDEPVRRLRGEGVRRLRISGDWGTTGAVEGGPEVRRPIRLHNSVEKPG